MLQIKQSKTADRNKVKFRRISNELKPCPFCGGEAEIIYCEDSCCHSQMRYIRCPNLDCNAEVWQDKDSIKAWNNRQDKGE